jgi:hypothetical protein
MATVRCYRCGIETLNLTGWSQTPRCGNCNAILPLPLAARRRSFGLAAEDGDEPGVDAATALRSGPDPA